MPSINLLKIGVDINYGPSFSIFSVPYKEKEGKNSPVSINLSVPWHIPQQDPTVLSLLTWNCAISNFRGRESELLSLNKWVEQDNPVSLRFITGPGGSGKNRLAAEFARSLQLKEWSAGFVDLDKQISYEVKNNNVLFLIDSPELSKNNFKILLKDVSMLDQFDIEEPWKIRILVLTRSDQSKWRDFLLEAGVVNIVDFRQIQLEGIDTDASHEIYNSALEKASELLNKVVPPISKEAINEWISQSSENKLPIFIVAAAIYDVLNPNDMSVKYSSKEILETIADYEIRRIVEIAEKNNVEDKYACVKKIAISCISGQVQVFDIEQSDCEISNLPIEPIKPDIIASAFTLLFLKKIPSGSVPMMIWEAVSSNLPGSLITISRIMYDAKTLLKIDDFDIEKYFEEAVKNDANRCEILFEHLNQDKSILLGKVTNKVCENILKQNISLPKKASTLILLSNNFSQSGDNDKAIRISRKAVLVAERLYASSPVKYCKLFAATLSNLAGDCLKDHLDKEAFENLKKASKLYGEFARNQPVSIVEYCIFLSNFGSYYLRINDYDNAIFYYKNALDTLEKLAERHLEIVRKELAFILSNISVCFQKRLDFSNALKSALAALKHYEMEAYNNPTQFEPEIARCCLNIATSFPANAVDREIQYHIERAIDIYKKYYEINPKAFADDLAKSYNVYSSYFKKIGAYQEAIECAESEKEIYSTNKMFSKKQYCFNIDLIKINIKIAHLYLEIDIKSANKYITESGKMIQCCMEKEKTEFEPLYADLLLVMSREKYLNGEINEAIKITDDALGLFKKCSKRNPAEFEPEVARCLYVLGYLHITKDEKEIALNHVTEGIRILSPHYKTQPDRYEGYMNNLVMAREKLI